MSKVQVIVPICNNQNKIHSCISSLINQDYNDMEILVIDMESMDDSVKIIKESYPNVDILVLSENKGLGDALNIALKNTGSKYIMTISPHVEVKEDYVKTMLLSIEDDKNIFSSSGVLVYKNDLNKVHSAGFFYTASGRIIKAYKNKSLEKLRSLSDKKQLLVFSPNIYGAIFRTKIFDEIGNFDANFFKFCEDIDIGWRASLFGYKNICSANSIASVDSDAVKNELDFRLIARNNSFMRYKNMPGWQRHLHSVSHSMENKKFDNICRKKGIDSYTLGIKEANSSRKKTCKIRYTKNLLKEQVKLEFAFKNKFI